MDMNELTKRLELFLQLNKMDIKTLSHQLGYIHPQKLYRLFSVPNAMPSCQLITDIADKFPELNLNWLFTGKSPIMNNNYEMHFLREECYGCAEKSTELLSHVAKILP